MGLVLFRTCQRHPETMTTPLHATAKELAEKLCHITPMAPVAFNHWVDRQTPLILAALQRVHDEASNVRLSSVAREQAARIAELEKELDNAREDSILLNKLEYDETGNSLGYACVFIAYPPEQGGEYPVFSGNARVRGIIKHAIAARAAIDAARSAANQEGRT